MRKLIVEVCNAHNLMPKDGQGTSSPYVVADFDGQRLRTATKMKDLNPQWDEKLEFRVNEPESMASEVLEINVHNDKKNNGKRSNFLGRLKISGNSFMSQGAAKLVYYPLDKRSVFSQIKGELGLKIYYVDEEAAPTTEEKPKEGEGGTEEEAKKDETAPLPAETIIAGETEKSENPPSSQEKKENAESASATEEKDTKTSEEKPSEQKSGEEKPAEGVISPPKEASNSEEATKTEAPKDPVYRPQAPVTQPSYPADFALKDLDRSLGAINGERTSTYDLVEQMPYLYVRLVKARNLAAKDLNGSSDPYARIGVGNHSIKTRTVNNNLNPMWNQVFAICKEKLSSPMLEVSLWDEDVGKKDDFLGCVSFDLQEVPKRVPPDSPLAPQWYRLAANNNLHGQGKVKGDIMLAVWMGTQADEAFPEAWQSDTGGLLIHTRSKVYLSPKLWYLRVNVIEAQDLNLHDKGRYKELSVKAQLGSQIFRTRTSSTAKVSSPFWNEDLVFVAAEPFEEHLVLTVEDRVGPNKEEIIGQTRVLLHTIERRTDHRQVRSLWFNLENEQGGKDNNKFDGRLHLRLCFDGGYHVLDEAAHLTSDVRPTAKQLWKPALGVLKLGILGAKNLMPMKSKDGHGTTDAYCVAKYGQKWIRSRTVVDSFSPRWNEQYTWEVYDPCTVLSLGVFDNSQIIVEEKDKPQQRKDLRIGKVRIRISTLESERIYTNSYPLLVLHQGGIKKMGEIELAVRFSRFSVLNMLQVYTQPLLPKMHYLYPLGVGQQDVLRHTAMKIVSVRLSRSEPPLRQEVVQFMLDSESHMWSMRRSKANWFRIMNVLSGPFAVFKWLDNIRHWKNPITTVLVHVLFLILVWYPELILPTVFLYMFLIGAWSYRFRPRLPPHMDARLSSAHAVNGDELDEEFDAFPTSRSTDIVRMRYDRLRSLAGRFQTVMGDMATQGERFCCLLRWRDPRATAIFVVFCLMAAIVTYMVPFRIIAILSGLYYLRHPRFRDPVPCAPLSFFRRLPALSDRIL